MTATNTSAIVAAFAAASNTARLNAETAAKRHGMASMPNVLPVNAPAAVPAKVLTAKPDPLAFVDATAFQRGLFTVLFDAEDKINRVILTQRERIESYLAKEYGDVSPTFEQFQADRKALAALSLERGLVDDQVVRKAYNVAIKALFGALPVSDSPAAIAKRLQRPTAAPRARKVAGEGVDSQEGGERVQEAEIRSISQFIATFGAANVLVELAKILATEKATQLDARTLVAVASHLTTKAA